LNLQQVSIFPGEFLNGLDCGSLIENFAKEFASSFKITLIGPPNWKKQKFILEFTPQFKDEAFISYEQKGKEVYEKAKTIEEIYSLPYQGELYCSGYLRFDFGLPDSWDEKRRQMAAQELEFQLYHVAKNFYLIIKDQENLSAEEFRKFFTALGEDASSVLAENISRAIKESALRRFWQISQDVNDFKKKLGGTGFFEILVLTKSTAYKTIQKYCEIRVEEGIVSLEKDFLLPLNRVKSIEDVYRIPHEVTQETINILERFLERMKAIRELFNLQLSLTSTFFEMTALTVAVFGIALSTTNVYLSAGLIIMVAVIMFLAQRLIRGYSQVDTLRDAVKKLEDDIHLFKLPEV
jgi:hypothetical protein